MKSMVRVVVVAAVAVVAVCVGRFVKNKKDQ